MQPTRRRPKQRLTAHISLMVSPEMRARLGRLADQWDVSISDVVRWILDQYFDGHEESGETGDKRA